MRCQTIFDVLKREGLPVWSLHAFGLSDGSIADIAALGGANHARSELAVLVEAAEPKRKYPARRRGRKPHTDASVMADIQTALGALAS